MVPTSSRVPPSLRVSDRSPCGFASKRGIVGKDVEIPHLVDKGRRPPLGTCVEQASVRPKTLCSTSDRRSVDGGADQLWAVAFLVPVMEWPVVSVLAVGPLVVIGELSVLVESCKRASLCAAASEAGGVTRTHWFVNIAKPDEEFCCAPLYGDLHSGKIISVVFLPRYVLPHWGTRPTQRGICRIRSTRASCGAAVIRGWTGEPWS